MRSRINWQYDWRGNQIQNLRILVDHRCEDIPNEQLRPIIIGPDPYPVRDPRPGFAGFQQGPQPPVQTPLEIITDDEGIGNSVFPPLPANFGLFNTFTGPLGVSSANYWPTNTVGLDHPGLASYGLAPGDLWSIGGRANVVPGNVPDPTAPLVFFGQINSFQLLSLRGKNLPLFNPNVLNALWNNNGVVWISGFAAEGLINDNGVLQLTNTALWPTSDAALPAGAVWNDGLTIAVVPGLVLSAPPVFFGVISSIQLLLLGGAGLPLSDPGVLNQLWNNNGLVCVSFG